MITEDQKNSSVVFWECTKGIKMDLYSPKIVEYYKSVHVVYSHN